MNITPSMLFPVLAKFNPWVRGQKLELPKWRRAPFGELARWALRPPAPRAVFLSGARQVGKTTLLLQLIEYMLDSGIAPNSILYASMDVPFLKIAGIDVVISAWKEMHNIGDEILYIFIDEIQYQKDWESWIKINVDFNKKYKIIFTGSSLSIRETKSESCVGRVHTCKISTLSFYEYIKLNNIIFPDISKISSLADLFSWTQGQFSLFTLNIEPLMPYFYEYIFRGGFPQTAIVKQLEDAQRMIREDIIDRVISKDMSSFYGVRHILDLENIFLYICMHDGSIIDIKEICENLSINRLSVQNYIELLEAVYLIKRIRPFGYGKDILRGKYKFYICDSSISPAMLFKGNESFSDYTFLGQCVESVICKHIVQYSYYNNIKISYWKNKKKQEVDFVASLGDKHIPIEVKHREQHTEKRDFPGLIDFMATKGSPRGYIATKSAADFGLVPWAPVVKIPAPLLCWWLGENDYQEFLL